MLPTYIAFDTFASASCHVADVFCYVTAVLSSPLIPILTLHTRPLFVDTELDMTRPRSVALSITVYPIAFPKL